MSYITPVSSSSNVAGGGAGVPPSSPGPGAGSDSAAVIRQPVLPQDLVEIAELTQKHSKTEGQLPFTHYVEFWEGTLANGRNATCYFTVHFAKMLSIETGDDKGGSYLDILRRLVNVGWSSGTDLPKLASAVPMNSDLRVITMQTLYLLLIFYDIDIEFPPLRALLDMAKALFTQGRTFAEEITRLASNWNTRQDLLMHYLVDRAISIDSADFLTDMCPEQVMCVVNHALRERCLHLKDAKQIFEATAHFARNPGVGADHRILPLMHLFRQFLMISPPTKSTSWLIKNVLQTLKRKYYLWPLPWSEVASNLLQELSVEVKAPGTLFRSTFLREHPELISSNRPTGKEHVVHILVDESNSTGVALGEILRTQSSGDLNVEEMHYALLTHVFEIELGLDAEMLGLEYLEKADLQGIFDSVTEVYSNAVLLSDEDAVEYRYSELLSIKTKAIEKCTPTKRRPSLRTPRPPPMEFQVFRVSPDTSDPAGNMMHGVRIPHRTSNEVLTQIFNQYVPFTERPEKPEVKIMVVGDDITFHNVAWSYLHLRCLIRELFLSLNVKFYFVPSRPSSRLGTFLATNDLWYGRNVALLPQSILKVTPTLQGVSPIATAGITGEVASAFLHKATAGFSPAKLLRRGIQAYFREASYPLPITVFQCECWSDSGSASLYTIPFLQRVEIGWNAYLVGQLKLATQDSAGNAKILTKWQPSTLSIKFTMMSPAFVQRTAPPLEPKPYHSIVLANVPSAQDRGHTPANPVAPYLELFLEGDQKKRRERAINYHVTVVEIESPDSNKKFEVLIDGSLFGPFQKLKISTCTVSTGGEEDHLKLPIMLFSPLAL